MLPEEPEEHALLDKTHLRNLVHLTGYRAACAIAGEWLLIGACIFVFFRYPYLPIYILCWLIIGSRQYALYALLHDGIHRSLFRNKKVNDWVCCLFLAWPLFIDFEKIRETHLAHHRHLQKPDDPEMEHLRYAEFRFPQAKKDMERTFLRDITGLNYLRYKLLKIKSLFNPAHEKASAHGTLPATRMRNVQNVLMLLAVFILIGFKIALPCFLLWLMSYATVYQALNRLRLSTEHFHLEEETMYHTRSVHLPWWQRFFLSPYNLGYHTEHHLYPRVPFYRLPALHHALMKQEQFRKNVLIDTSYQDALDYYSR